MSLPTEGIKPRVISNRLLKPYERLTPAERPTEYPKQWTRPRPVRPSWKPDPATKQGYELSESYSNVRNQAVQETSFGGDGLRHRNVGKLNNNNSLIYY